MPFADPPKIEFAYHANGRQKFSGWRRVYRLAEPFVYVDPRGFLPRISVEAGFESDLATLPLLPFVLGGLLASVALNICATWYFNDAAEIVADGALVALVVLLVGYLRPDGPWAAAAIIHDALYRQRRTERDVADTVMRKIMLETGVPRAVAFVFWATLRLFGWAAWHKRTLLAAVLALLLVAPASAETLLISFVGESCPHCRRWERTLAEPQVQRDLAAAKVRSLVIDEQTLTQAQADNWRLTGVPLVALGETNDRGHVQVLRRSEGPLTADELRAWLRGGAQ